MVEDGKLFRLQTPAIEERERRRGKARHEENWFAKVGLENVFEVQQYATPPFLPK